MHPIPALFTHQRKLAFGLYENGHIGLVRYLRDLNLQLARSKMPTEATRIIAVGDECLAILSSAGLLEPLLMAMASDMNQAVLKQVAKFGGAKYAKQQEAIRKQRIIRGTL